MSEQFITIDALLEADAHFGHITRRWNPKMKKFIYGERNGIHIIDLRKTQILIEYACDVIKDIASLGKTVLFVGTKADIKYVIEEQAKRAKTNYVSERWLGGMLTNFPTIRRSINRLTNIDRMETDGTFDSITKKERLLLTRERERLRKVFGGIENMTNLPGAIFVIDARREHLAVKEAKVLGIPVIGIIDTNTDPDIIDYPIPANDDSFKTAQIITTVIADCLIEAGATAKIRKSELGYRKDNNHRRDFIDNDKSRRFKEKGPGQSSRRNNNSSRGERRERFEKTDSLKASSIEENKKGSFRPRRYSSKSNDSTDGTTSNSAIITQNDVNSTTNSTNNNN